MFTGINAGLFLTPPKRLDASDVLDGQKISRIWLPNENNWEVFRISDAAKILVEREIAAQWHEATRDNFGAACAPGPPGTRNKPSAVRKIDYEFLTQQRTPEESPLD
jgi:hypothetical protein